MRSRSGSRESTSRTSRSSRTRRRRPESSSASSTRFAPPTTGATSSTRSTSSPTSPKVDSSRETSLRSPATQAVAGRSLAGARSRAGGGVASMSLPVPNLDDRTFQDLVDEAKRLIPRYCPEWTNHNLTDPGVALIELFAWMTELSLFRLNQVPDKFYTHMLNMLGFERFPATAARTDLTFWLVDVVNEPVVIPAGTQVGTTGDVGSPRV